MNAEQIICQRWLAELDVDVSEWGAALAQRFVDTQSVSTIEHDQSASAGEISVSYIEGKKESLLYFLLEEPQALQHWKPLLTDIALALGVSEWACFSLSLGEHSLGESVTPQLLKTVINQCGDVGLSTQVVIAFHNALGTRISPPETNLNQHQDVVDTLFLSFSDLLSFSRNPDAKAQLWATIKHILG